ncbi:MAG TPA: response regulator, partial [Flavobacterium sp.]|uniref:LytR/AlgR family response regulator transcription factor n=1 Tax=Flavobacterium sp. TaxID=239 RepID=UPI002DB997A4
MKIRCVIIDDEPLAIKVLLNYFENFSDFEVIGTFNNSLEGLEFINSNNVDAVFLDINMPMMTGFELISLIENKTRVVITTAFREFAAESYDLEVLDYLVKPIPLPRFIKCIHKIEAEYNLKNNIKIENHRIEP